MNNISHWIPWTRIKIGMARPLCWLARALCRRDRLTIKRSGIRYAIDLREGLDLSLFWFGSFQKSVFESRLFSLPADGVVLDVGANFGLMSLQYAKAVTQGHVYSFEPTDYALAHLKENLALNPDLAKRITIIQSFISDEESDSSQFVAYSSWPVDGKGEKSLHPLHGGVAQRTETVGQITLDEFVGRQSLARVDLIKIDTDGYEAHVLRGAKQLLMKYKPLVIFEAGQYSLRERNSSLEKLWDCLSGYRVYNLRSGREIMASERDKQVPENSTVDMIAIPYS